MNAPEQRLDYELLAQHLLQQIGALLCRFSAQPVDLGSPQEPGTIMGATENSRPPSVKSSEGKRISEITDELLIAKQADGLSFRYIATVRGHLRRFAAHFDKEITIITAPEIDVWLRGLAIGPRARNNIRGSVVTLFRFARKLGYLPKGHPTEADDIAKAKEWGGKIGILKPADLAAVLARATDRVRLFLALGAFSGMRTSEMIRLGWEDMNFERAFITVAAEKTKTATRRLVPILPNLAEWLRPYRGWRGQLFKTRRDADSAIAFAKSCSIAWPNNALRHSYASYRLAATANAAKVALEMGNSPQKLMRNYRELVDETEARAWFSISPPAGANIVAVTGPSTV